MTWLSNEAVSHLRAVATWPSMPTDRYELLRPIGRGGMGTVYAARDRLLDRDVAIKVSNAADADSPLDERLRQEARVLARLEHPGLVPVHDAGRLTDGRLYYVMKLVRGETLSDHLASVATESSRLAIFERVAETVAFAHAAGIVHRDLKPSNIMVGTFGQVLVLDWGVAMVVGTRPRAPGEVESSQGHEHDAQDRTRAGTVVGTPGFMAPEQAGDGPVGPAADVYALGALLFWMLTGTPPPGDPDAAQRSLVASGSPPSRRLRAIVGRALAPAASDRYPTAGALVDDLIRYRAGVAVSAHREHVLERLGRWAQTHHVFILLVLAYLLMRTLFAFWMR